MCPDPLEAVKNVIHSFIKDEPKSPLHIGEAMSCWSFLALIAETQVQTEAGINSTADPELIKALHEAAGMLKSQKERLAAFMRVEGVPLPPVSESKPISDPNSVPLGVKLDEKQLANSLRKKISISIANCATTASQTLRVDVSLMWAEIMLEQITFLTNFKSLMRKRGWLNVPPFYLRPGSINTGR